MYAFSFPANTGKDSCDSNTSFPVCCYLNYMLNAQYLALIIFFLKLQFSINVRFPFPRYYIGFGFGTALVLDLSLKRPDFCQGSDNKFLFLYKVTVSKMGRGVILRSLGTWLLLLPFLKVLGHR